MANLFSNEEIQALGYQTPYFLFSKDKLRAQYEEYRACFPDASVHYAVKANAEPELLQFLVELGCGFEVASKYELDQLKAVDAPAENIIYGTSVKPADHIRAFAEYGVDRFACDSFPELEKIAIHAPGSRVFMRISVDDTGSVFKFSEKFGTSAENAVALLLRAREMNLIPYGISFHVGSQASNPKAWAQALRHIIPSIEELSRTGITLGAINIGGGFPCAYASFEQNISLKEIADETLAAYAELPYQPTMLLEPGRGIVATTAIAVVEVIARVERNQNTWLFVDAGVYQGFFETMAYQGSTRYRITSLRPSYDAGESLFAIAGPTGDSPDVITRETLLPSDIGVGDKLLVHDVGAYSLVAVSPFNGFPKPDVYFH
jgi:ornithine decarboxylase